MNELPTVSRSARRAMLLSDWHSSQMRRGVARFARQAGWVLDPLTAHRAAPHLADAGWMPSPRQRRKEPALARLVQRISAKGIGLITLSCANPAIRQVVEQTAVPAVDLGLGDSPRPVGHVVGDHQRQGHVAGRELAQRGYRRFVFYLNRPTPISRLRRRGLGEAVQEAGGSLTDLEWEAARRAGKLSFEDWEPWLAEQVGRLETPVAVVAVGDELAVHVLDACRAAGRMVPEQVAVVGFDNDQITCEHALVPLSSVDTNLEEIGYRAAALLDRLMDGEPIPAKPTRVPPRGLVVRQSSNLIAIDHPEVARAVRYLLAYYTDPGLTIADVAAATDTSRRNLDRTFVRTLGRTVAEELSRVRLEHAKRLLAETERTVGAIAAEAGFTGRDHLRQALHRATGLTPRAYRRRPRAGRA
jgi:LacI family transcriptional regulator